jgi:hypothetical protein
MTKTEFQDKLYNELAERALDLIPNFKDTRAKRPSRQITPNPAYIKTKEGLNAYNAIRNAKRCLDNAREDNSEVLENIQPDGYAVHPRNAICPCGSFQKWYEALDKGLKAAGV